MPRRRIHALLWTAAVVAGCAPRARKVTPLPVQPPATFSESGAASMPARWWTVFGDPGLDRAVEQALASNLDLVTAWQRLRQAQAIVDRESSFLWPDLEVQLDGSSRQPEEDGDGESLRLGLSSVYEIDLWGRIRSAVEAERLRARATLSDYRTVALTLSAEVARTWYQLVEARRQRAILAEQVETNEQVLDLIAFRFGTGQIRRVDILRQEQLIEATRAERLAAESRVAVLEHLLAVLLGRAPQDGVEVTRTELPSLPPLPRAGLPAELVRRRPDVARAHALLQAADRDLATAVANRSPRLLLTGSVSTSGDEDEGEMFQDWTRTLTASLIQPLFDAGRRRAEVDRTEALRLQRLHEWGQATLVAFREVEDALVQERKQVERIDSLEKQVDLAARTYEQLRTEYFNGVSDYIDVLTALTDEQRLRRDLLSARLARLELRIALYRALAGGFETPREATG